MRNLSNVEKIVVKVGTSTLTYENGRLNFKRIEVLARVLSDLQNAGKSVVLVSSGAIGVGRQIMGLDHRPSTVQEKQAAAAVGQPQLMEIYDEFFRKYSQKTAQILLTHMVIDNVQMYKNAVNTLKNLCDYQIIPIVNENDTVVTDEILFGDNDTLSAHIAQMVQADLLILLTDIDGLYDADPSKNSEARLILKIEKISDEIKAMAGDSASNRGTGGMLTKIAAAEIAHKFGTKTIIMNGESPENIYNILEGEEIGTYFE